MAVKFNRYTAINGGATGAMDADDGDRFLDGDFAFVTVGGNFYVYIFDDDNAGAESSPDIIAPDAPYAGDGRWVLQAIYGGGDTLPIVDTTAVVKGSADATKLVRIEADGITTSTTRVITMPDADVDLTADTGTFASAAKGVTGGDSHDHTGGDGAAIPDTSFSSGATVISAGAGDGGKLVKLDADGNVDASTINSTDVDHDGTTNFVANEHINHTSVTLTAGAGLSGGGDISANRSFAVDITELDAEATIADDDLVLIYDTSESAHNKMTKANFVAGLGGLTGITTSGIVALGTGAGDDASGAVALAAVGASALTAVTSGVGNTAIGDHAGAAMTTNGQGVFVGYYAGASETAAQKLYIANNSSAAATLIYGDFASQYVAPGTTETHDLGIGANNYEWDNIYLNNSPTVNSDIRGKEEIIDSPLGLDFINALRPVSYKKKDLITEGTTKVIKVKEVKEIDPVTKLPVYEIVDKIVEDEPAMGVRHNRKHYGFIAQEVVSALDYVGVSTADFSGIVDGRIANPERYQDKKTGEDIADKGSMALRYEQFIAPLCRAVQQLSAEVEILKLQIAA